MRKHLLFSTYTVSSENGYVRNCRDLWMKLTWALPCLLTFWRARKRKLFRTGRSLHLYVLFITDQYPKTNIGQAILVGKCCHCRTKFNIMSPSSLQPIICWTHLYDRIISLRGEVVTHKTSHFLLCQARTMSGHACVLCV